jgi:hypothetical protein
VTRERSFVKRHDAAESLFQEENHTSRALLPVRPDLIRPPNEQIDPVEKVSNRGGFSLFIACQEHEKHSCSV